MCEQLLPSYHPTQLHKHLQSLLVFQKDKLETVHCLCTLKYMKALVDNITGDVSYVLQSSHLTARSTSRNEVTDICYWEEIHVNTIHLPLHLLCKVLKGGRTWGLFSSAVNFEVNGRGGKTGRLPFWGLTAEDCGLERVGNRGGEGCGMECVAESKPRGTANVFRRIPSGFLKSVGKNWSRHKKL